MGGPPHLPNPFPTQPAPASQHSTPLRTSRFGSGDTHSAVTLVTSMHFFLHFFSFPPPVKEIDPFNKLIIKTVVTQGRNSTQMKKIPAEISRRRRCGCFDRKSPAGGIPPVAQWRKQEASNSSKLRAARDTQGCFKQPMNFFYCKNNKFFCAQPV